MKIAIVGGHLTPALSVIDALPATDNIIFIGREYALEGDSVRSLEYNVITKRGITFRSLITGKLHRSISKYTFLSLIKIPYGLIHAYTILSKDRPDGVIAFGGYLSVPVGIAAYFLRIPFVIHEQTLQAGLANKLLSPFASKICISWKQSARFFPKNKVIVTGNPIRRVGKTRVDIPLLYESRHIPLLFITGGSSGAHAINTYVEGCLENLLSKYRIIHQTGDAKPYNDFDRLQTLKNTLPVRLQNRYFITKFVDPYAVGHIMKEARLVISRAGMNTVTELLHYGKSCLLIPLPYGQKYEQLKNAVFVKKVGIGEYLLQDSVTPHTFLARIETMIEHQTRYVVHGSFAKSLIYTDAADRIVRIIYEVISGKA